MASMGPFPSERRGRDIDDLPIWSGMDGYRYEWNEFYSSKSWNIAPFEFEKIPVSPASPIVQKEVVKRRRSSKSTVSKRLSLSDSIKSEEGGKAKKSKLASNKKKKKKSLPPTEKNGKISKPKSKKKKKKKKKKKGARSIGTSSSSLDTFCTLDSADIDIGIESSTEFSSASFLSNKSLLESTVSGGYAELPDDGPGPLVSPRATRSSVSFLSPAASFRNRSERSLTSFGPLSPSMKSMGSLGESRNSIMGCDISEDVMQYIDEVYQDPMPVPEPPLLLDTDESRKADHQPKKTKKKKKKRKSTGEKALKSSAKEAKAEDDVVVEKKPTPTRQKSLPKEERKGDVKKKPSSTKSRSEEQAAEKRPSSEKRIGRSKETEEIAEKKPTSTRAKTASTMETLPEEITLSMKLSQPAAPKRSHTRSLSPKRTNRFSKFMVVSDGSIRRLVEKKNKSPFWDRDNSAKRRGSVKQSIHAALGEIERSSLDFDDSEGLEKTADFSVGTEITDPWHNSWSVSSDSFRDDSDRAFKRSMLSPNLAHGEHVKRIKPL